MELSPGHGIYKWPDGSVYNGTWLNDKMSGFGVMTSKTHEKYVGEWKGNKRDGNGTEYDKMNRLIRTGIWKEGIYIEN